MRWRARRLLLAGCLALLGTGATSADPPVRDASPPSAEEVLARAFAARYEVGLTSVIDLVTRNVEGAERLRRLHATSKLIGDRVHSIGRLVEPRYLRGMTVLTIEAKNRSHDAFVYLPSMGRVRRITTAHRSDAVFGTDVTYEDLERQRVEDYELEPLRATTWSDAPAYLVMGRPIQHMAYDRARFTIARSDYAILVAEYFKPGESDPYRVITASREGFLNEGGHAIPTRLRVENRQRHTVTDVHLRHVEIDPEIDDGLFSIQTLEAGHPLPVKDR